MSPRVRRLPLVTLFLVAGGARVLLLPGSVRCAALRFERAALTAGEWWRLFSAALVHVSPAVAACDLGALLVLGTLQESAVRARWLLTLALAAPAASLAVSWGSSFERYAGASSLVAAGMAAALVDLLRARRRGARVLGAALLVAFAAKCALELAGRPVPFAAPLPSGTSVAAQAYLASALVGLGVALVWPALSPSCASASCAAPRRIPRARPGPVAPRAPSCARPPRPRSS